MATGKAADAARSHAVMLALVRQALLDLPVSSLTTEDLGGWKSEAMMRRYAALTNEALRTGRPRR